VSREVEMFGLKEIVAMNEKAVKDAEAKRKAERPESFDRKKTNTAWPEDTGMRTPPHGDPLAPRATVRPETKLAYSPVFTLTLDEPDDLTPALEIVQENLDRFAEILREDLGTDLLGNFKLEILK
jgi:hypothetical protein